MDRVEQEQLRMLMMEYIAQKVRETDPDLRDLDSDENQAH